MEKKLIAALIPILLLTGCQNSKPNPDQVEKMALMQERRLGIMQSLGGAMMSSQATHLLRMNDGKTIYLKSTLIDLSAEKYSGKEVEVMGEITRTTDGNQTMAVKSIDLIDTEVSASEDLPEWVAYNSDNLGLGLKYRNDYLLSDSVNQITIEAKPPETPTSLAPTTPVSKPEVMTTIKLELLSKNDNFDLASEMNVLSLNNADVLAGGYNRSKITQKAVDAYKFSGDGGKSIVYFLKVTNGSYKIAFSAGSEAENLIVEQNMFYDILASVDFAGLPMAESPVVPDSDGPHLEGISTDNGEAGEVNTDIDADVDSDTNTETPDAPISGFEVFKSDTLQFSMQYPKSYYFSSVGASAGATKSYQFGSQPLEEQTAEITLDLVKALPSEGKTTDYNGTSITKVTSGGVVSVYLSQNGKVFKLTGPSSQEELLKQMLVSVEN